MINRWDASKRGWSFERQTTDGWDFVTEGVWVHSFPGGNTGRRKSTSDIGWGLAHPDRTVHREDSTVTQATVEEEQVFIAIDKSGASGT